MDDDFASTSYSADYYIMTPQHWGSPWYPIVGPYPNGSHENRTIDVLCKSCLNNFDPIACVRSAFLSLLSALTGLYCLMRLVKFHTSPSPPCYHRLVLFYILIIHCLVGMVEWVIGWTTQSSLACAYLRSLELLIICHFYLTLTCRVMHWSSEVTSRISVFGLTIMYLYFTSFLVFGLVFAFEPWKDCYAPYWIWISGGNVLTVHLIVVTFLLLCKRINTVSTTDSLKREQKRDLYSLVWAFETSVWVDLAYHVTLFLLANDELGCSGVFKHQQILYSSIMLPYTLITVLMPIWVVLWVFRPRSSDTFGEGSTTLSTQFSRDSFMDPALPNVITVRGWRRRYRPLNPGQLQPTTNYTASTDRRSSRRRSRARSSGMSTPGQGRSSVSRSSSAPTLPISRRNTVAQNLSSPLYPIPEENSSNNSSANSNEEMPIMAARSALC